ncbi:MAG: hypothetical protein S4CHLAM81_02660 [Chlamydiales bacterium]|nr:hypothetical protein [Chlamydiales bacterium]MCH9635057.1 hypothetical protein [Chlamydiales bacterium]MCH9703652.1 hypothetical protein [Chlamydiota bacterium]
MQEYIDKGWVVLDFPDISELERVKEELEGRLSSLVGKKCSLEEYREEDDSRHSKIQIEMTQFFREQEYDFITPLLPAFREIMGLDIVKQANPFLRIARPGKSQDNIGYHRDSHYGGTPYEHSFFVPFVELGPKNTMSMIDGSHLESEEAYPTTKIQSKEVTKGSKKHQLGFLYAPQKMEDSVADRVKPVPLKFGQALVFCLPVVHGCIMNGDSITRWSSDQRLMPTYAPVEMGERQVKYTVVSESPTAVCARRYEEANGKRCEVELGLCLQQN